MAQPRTIAPKHELTLWQTLLVALAGCVLSSLLLGQTLAFPSPDLRQIAWDPGRQFLAEGAVSASYPYPLWTLALMFPLVLAPFEVSSQIWLACNLLLLALTVAGIFSLLEWPRRPGAVAVVGLLAGCYSPVFLILWMGQTVIVSLATLVLLALAVRDQRWALAGALIGIGLFKPQLVALVGGAVLLTALWQRQWRAPFAFAAVAGLFVLLGIPFAANPAQIFGGGAAEHLELYIGRTSSLWGLLLTEFPATPLLPAAVCLSLGAAVAIAWFRAIRAGNVGKRLIYLIVLTTVVNLLILPYSWSYNHGLLILPLAYSASIAWRLPLREQLAWSCALAAAFLAPAIVHTTIVQQQRSDVYTIISVLVVLPLLVALQLRADAQDGYQFGVSPGRVLASRVDRVQ
jgi:hypothetical protein